MNESRTMQLSKNSSPHKQPRLMRAKQIIPPSLGSQKNTWLLLYLETPPSLQAPRSIKTTIKLKAHPDTATLPNINKLNEATGSFAIAAHF